MPRTVRDLSFCVSKEVSHEIRCLVSSKITSTSGQLIQRIRLYDEEEHPTQNNIMVDEDLVQYYQLLADRGDAQAQVKSNFCFGETFELFDVGFFSMASVNYTIFVTLHMIKRCITFVWPQKMVIRMRWPI